MREKKPAKKRFWIPTLMILMMLAIGSQFAAAACSGMSDFFYGTVKIDDADAPAGTQIRAILSTEARGSYTTATSGLYGSANGDDKLAVSGSIDGSDYMGTISFQIFSGGAWITTPETSIYECGNVKNINLSIQTSQTGENDDDGDGYDETIGDCNDANSSINPGATETCNGVDDDCDGQTDEGGNALCSNGLFCDGTEICSGALGCQAGVAVDCSQNNLPGISSCTNDPDNNPFTLDISSEFVSSCDEITDLCTQGSYIFTHTCNIAQCSAQCESDLGCEPTDCTSNNGCYAGQYREYYPVLSICSGCACTQGTCNDFMTIETDIDGDGADVECELDCKDNDSSVYPGAAEACDAKDNNCDGSIDEGLICDTDNDGVQNTADNCISASNPGQEDTDADGVGDACDNCPSTSNPAQIDSDSDGIGDACDNDDDNDGLFNGADNCPAIANPGQEDTDADGVGDVCDNCINISNPQQINTDSDAFGDVCDTDDDNDGVNDTNDAFPLNPAESTDSDGDGIGNNADNCPQTPNTDQNDTDGDGIGNICDNCPLISNADQSDSDNDGVGNACDSSSAAITSTGSGGGGGGGSSRAASLSSAVNQTLNQSQGQSGNPSSTETSGCVPSWVCGDWGGCASGIQTRTCTDTNECGTNEGKPEGVRSCEAIQEPPVLQEENLITGNILGVPLTTTNLLIAIFVLLLATGAGIFAYFKIYK